MAATVATVVPWRWATAKRVSPGRTRYAWPRGDVGVGAGITAGLTLVRVRGSTGSGRGAVGTKGDITTGLGEAIGGGSTGTGGDTTGSGVETTGGGRGASAEGTTGGGCKRFSICGGAAMVGF